MRYGHSLDLRARVIGAVKARARRVRRRGDLTLARRARSSWCGVGAAKLKALLRKAAARTLDQLWQVIADSIDRFNPQECRLFRKRRICV